MGGMLLNKIAGAGLAVVLVILGLLQLPSMLFSQGGEGHHDDHHGEELSLNEQIAATYAYYIPIADGGSAGPEEPEEVFDLGAALASADVSRGASSFQQKCASCHSIDEGAPNGIGPNLHGVVGAAKHHHGDFRYSGAMTEMGGEWTYEDLNAWLKAPSSYISGTSMGFAGLNRDGERANVIAYLASQSPDAPAFPAALPDEPAEEAAPVEDTEGATEEAPAMESDGTVLPIDTDAVEDAIDEATDAAGDVLQDVSDSAEDLVETVEDAIDEATDPETPEAEEH